MAFLPPARPSPRGDGPGRMPFWVLCVMLLLALLRLWLVSYLDLTAVAGAELDDALFVEQAEHLLQGEWLGPYDERRLVKGPFYSFFLAAVYLLGVPLLAAQQALYTLACWVVAQALLPWLGRRWGPLALFTVLLCQPMAFTLGANSRVIREGIYPVLTLLVFAGALGLLLRARRPLGRLLPWSLLLGLALAAVFLTREEGIWLVPSVGLLLAGAAVEMLRPPVVESRVPRAGRRWRLAGRWVLLFLPFAVLWGSHQWVEAKNLREYGVDAVVEIQAPPFRDAYGAMTRVGAVFFSSRAPMPREARAAAYGVSPTFAELEPHLEGKVGEMWEMISRTDGFPGDRDISGGWFLWAVRHAAAEAGWHSTAETAAEHYARVAEEINRACDAGRMPCGPPRSSLSPPWRPEYAGPLVGRTLHGARFLARLEAFVLKGGTSQGTEEGLERFRILTREEVAPRKLPAVSVEGWVVVPGAEPGLEVRTVTGEVHPARVRFLPSPAAHAFFLEERGRDLPGARRARYRIWMEPCWDCRLAALAGGEARASLPLTGDAREIDRRDLYFSVWPQPALERMPGDRELAGGPALDATRRRILESIAAVFRQGTPPLALAALVAWSGLVAVAVWRRRLESEALIPVLATTALAGALLARLLILALIDVTSFPAIHPGYLAPAYPLLYAFVVVALVAAGRWVWGWWRVRARWG